MVNYYKRAVWLWYAGKFMIHYKCRDVLRLLSERDLHRGGGTITEGNDLLKVKIESGIPFMAGRIGFTEMAVMTAFEFNRNSKKNINMKNLYLGAGFFPNDCSLGIPFLELMKDCCSKVDIYCPMKSMGEDYFIHSYMGPHTVFTSAIMNPWNYSTPWTSALQGKKVLVVHPFKDSILKQYQKRERLFEGNNVLPEFKLIVFKAVQTMGNETDIRFDTWFDALSWMSDEIIKLDFDIAIIGCGAYGFPLAANIKAMGKQAVHMGGTTQLLFGIKGHRWVDPESGAVDDAIKPYVNDSWVWPLDSETPKSACSVDGAYFKTDHGVTY